MYAKNTVYCNIVITIILSMLFISMFTNSKVIKNDPEYEAQEAARSMLTQMMDIPEYRSIADEISSIDNPDETIFTQQCLDYMYKRFSDTCTYELIDKLIAARYPLGNIFDAYEQQYNQFVEDIELNLAFSKENTYRYEYKIKLRTEYESGEQLSSIVTGRIGIETFDGEFYVTIFTIGSTAQLTPN